VIDGENIAKLTKSQYRQLFISYTGFYFIICIYLW